MMWKWLVLIIVLASLGFIAMLFYKAHLSKTGQAAGLVANQLTRCPNKPNCVCSEFSEDSEHFMEPIMLQGAPDQIMVKLKSALEAMGGVVTTQAPRYLAATFTSKFMGFVDDVELRLDEATGLVQIRSASRQGYSDLGVNRKRMEQFKQLLQK
ncbi:DUF1499 domain-containing protein [Thiofilum flexile]|uniref:DUF1499 domain-containing protein n=1 Tax=Thiofilum flexile TaxID=125627 RepID=UPI00047804CD|nr:DUF1499 domain-containing protein [Thiofilum flexile]